MPEKKKREGFIYGAIILSLSGVLVKLIGVFFKVPLTNMVGAANMSHFSSAFVVYNLMLSIATSGLPVGISAMVSSSLATGKYRDVKTLMRSVTVIFVSFGCLLTVLGLVFAPNIAVWMNSEDTVYCVRAIVPAILFMSVISVLRGFFQGYNNMTPTAISNIIEALVKLTAGIGLATYFKHIGMPGPVVVSGGIWGITLSTVVSMIYLILRYAFRSKTYRLTISEFNRDTLTPRSVLLKRFFAITIPILLSSVTVHLMGMIDSACVIQILKNYDGGLAEAQRLWGAYSTMSLTIFNLPSYIVISIGVSLVPSISGAFAKKDSPRLKYHFDNALKYSSIISFACAFGLCAVSKATIILFFGEEDADIASQLLEIISFALVAVGLTNVTGYILQAIGKATLSIISVATGALVKTVTTVTLLCFPTVGIFGAPIATNVAYPVMLIMNFVFINKNLHLLPDIKDVFLKPLIAGFGCFVSAKIFTFVFEKFLPEKIALFPVILLAGVVYFVLILAIKLVTINEIKQVMKKNKKNS